MAHIVTLLVLLFANLAHCQTTNDSVYHMHILLPDDDTKAFSYKKVMSGIKLGIDYVKDEKLLPSVVFKLTYNDTRCDLTAPVLSFIDALLKDQLDAIVGPACLYSCAPIARYVAHYNKVVVSGGCLSQAFKDKDEYFLTRLNPDLGGTSIPVATIISEFNWERVAMLFHHSYEDQSNLDCVQTFPQLRTTLTNRGIKEENLSYTNFHFIEAQKRNITEAEYLRERLKEINKTARSEYTILQFLHVILVVSVCVYVCVCVVIYRDTGISYRLTWTSLCW